MFAHIRDHRELREYLYMTIGQAHFVHACFVARSLALWRSGEEAPHPFR